MIMNDYICAEERLTGKSRNQIKIERYLLRLANNLLVPVAILFCVWVGFVICRTIGG